MLITGKIMLVGREYRKVFEVMLSVSYQALSVTNIHYVNNMTDMNDH